MTTRTSSPCLLLSFTRILFIAAWLAVACPTGFAGTWTRLTHDAPAGVNLMLLLPDGTVMAARNSGSIGSAWYRLAPDTNGSYVNGTWTVLASMHDTRLYYSSQVLKDGRVFVAGGEYGTGGARAEVYDPLTNIWTQINPPAALWTPASNNFVDSCSEILPDGRVLIMPVFPHATGIPLLYDPVGNVWSNAGKLKVGSNQSEATWSKLPDDSILTIDPFGTHSERYIPATNTWVNDSTVPVAVYDPFASELGGSLLLPNGKAIFIGSTGHTALYTPTGTTSPGVWIAGADIPAGKGAPDAPAAMLVTGNVLCAVSLSPSSGDHYPAPTTFYEYDPVANAFTSVGAPNGASDPISAFSAAMLDLPDGTVLYSHFGADLYTYQPSGAPLAAGKPAISSISRNGDGSYHLIGTGLNGISEGATYGDDLQMNSNYPLVRLTSGSNAYYGRTWNWSSTSVQTGASPVSTEFRVPASVPAGPYSLVVVANGIASDPVPFTQPDIGTWTAFGSGLPGLLGVPVLTGSGAQIGGQPVAITLSNTWPLSPAAFFVGVTNGPASFKGGVLIPVPWILLLGMSTSAAGTIPLAFAWPAVIPPALSIYYQYAVQDAFAVQGVALSNALQSTSP